MTKICMVKNDQTLYNNIPCPMVSFILMEDDGIIRCGDRFSLNELFTKISLLSSPESTRAI